MPDHLVDRLTLFLIFVLFSFAFSQLPISKACSLLGEAYERLRLYKEAMEVLKNCDGREGTLRYARVVFNVSEEEFKRVLLRLKGYEEYNQALFYAGRLSSKSWETSFEGVKWHRLLFNDGKGATGRTGGYQRVKGILCQRRGNLYGKYLKEHSGGGLFTLCPFGGFQKHRQDTEFSTVFFLQGKTYFWVPHT
jgi:hypothetical protein